MNQWMNQWFNIIHTYVYVYIYLYICKWTYIDTVINTCVVKSASSAPEMRHVLSQVIPAATTWRRPTAAPRLRCRPRAVAAGRWRSGSEETTGRPSQPVVQTLGFNHKAQKQLENHGLNYVKLGFVQTFNDDWSLNTWGSKSMKRTGTPRLNRWPTQDLPFWEHAVVQKMGYEAKWGFFFCFHFSGLVSLVPARSWNGRLAQRSQDSPASSLFVIFHCRSFAMAPMWLHFVLKMPLGIAILFGIGGRTMFGSFGFRKDRLPKISSWLCWERSGMLQHDLAKCILAHNRLAELQHHDTDICQSTIGFFNPYLFLTPS